MSGAFPQAQSLADRLSQAAERREPVEPVGAEIGDAGIDGAYAVQDINTERALAAGRRLAGRKIGLTSVAVQRQLGVDQPDYGMLFADMEVADGAPVPFGKLIQPKIEAEIAFVLRAGLAGERLTLADVVSAVDYALPAIEIVDSRIANWRIGILDTIADNASSGLYVLGSRPVSLHDLDLRLAGMVIEHRGEPVSVGCGAACLGNPLNAVLWLARTMAGVGRPLAAGDVVLSGALGPMVAAKPGETYETRIEGLGTVAARFAA